MNEIRFLRGTQADLDKLISKMKEEAEAAKESENEMKNELKSSNEKSV